MDMELSKEEEQISNIISDQYKYAAIYARESNASVTNPLETQRHICRKFALEKGLFIHKEYSESVSASKLPYRERTEFMKMLEDARKGLFKTIIATRRDRISRNFEEYIQLKKIFSKLGVEVLYSNDIDIGNTENYASRFIENIIVALAEMEPRRISARREAGINAKIQQGIYDRRPSYGFYKNEENKKYYQDGLKAEVVLDIFKIYLSDEKVIETHQIIEILKDKGNKRKENKEEYLELVSKLKKKI